MRRTLVPIVVIAGLVSVGCGSSKPGYCSARTDLKNAIQGLAGATSASTLKSSLQKIESSTKSIANSAKSDFPTEASALQSSVSALQATLRQAPTDPQAAIPKLPGDLNSVSTAITNFENATKSKCS